MQYYEGDTDKNMGETSKWEKMDRKRKKEVPPYNENIQKD